MEDPVDSKAGAAAVVDFDRSIRTGGRWEMDCKDLRLGGLRGAGRLVGPENECQRG